MRRDPVSHAPQTGEILALAPAAATPQRAVFTPLTTRVPHACATEVTGAAAITGQPQPRISIVDEDPSTLTLMSRALRARGHVVFAYGRADAFLQHFDSNAHGCVVIGVTLPEPGWLALLQKLTQDEHHAPVIVVSSRASVGTAVQAMKKRAFDFLAPVSEGALARAVDEAVAQDRELVTARVHRAAIEARLATLTASEYRVIGHVMAGLLNRQIAAELGSALKTIKVHRGRAMRKLRAHSAVLLARTLERIGPRNLELGLPAPTGHHEVPVRSWNGAEVEVD